MFISKKVQTPFGTIVVKESENRDKQARPILLVHGILSSSLSYEPLLKSTLLKNRVISFDLPGHGESTVSTQFSPSWPQFVEVLKSVVDVLELSSFDLLGHSMGGGISACFAAKHPQYVEKLVLIDSLTGHFKLPFKGRIPQIKGLGDFVFKVVYRQGLFFDYYRNDVFLDAKKVDVERVKTYYKAFDKHRHLTLKAVRATNNPQYIVDALEQILAPTLVVWGKQDPLIPLSVGEFTASKIKHSIFKTVSPSGHNPLEEAPEETIKIIEDFLTI